jgi:hypothetical protein
MYSRLDHLALVIITCVCKLPPFAAGKIGNSWRTSPDISQTWDSVLRNLDSVVGLAMHAGPGGWNDPDMLEVSARRPYQNWSGSCLTLTVLE